MITLLCHFWTCKTIQTVVPIQIITADVSTEGANQKIAVLGIF
jgi:hypothetical protein